MVSVTGLLSDFLIPHFKLSHYLSTHVLAFVSLVAYNDRPICNMEGTRVMVTIDKEDTLDKDTITVIIKGRQQEFSVEELTPDGELSFDQVVGRAYDPLPTGQDIVFEVSYFNGAGRPPQGDLDPGEKVKVQDGTVFNVDYTDRS